MENEWTRKRSDDVQLSGCEEEEMFSLLGGLR